MQSEKKGEKRYFPDGGKLPAKEGEEENPSWTQWRSLGLAIQRLLMAQWESFYCGEISTEDREVGQK